jgi:hypothetical protein
MLRVEISGKELMLGLVRKGDFIELSIIPEMKKAWINPSP